MRTYRSFSSRETAFLGARVAREMLSAAELPSERRRAMVVLLRGELGAGKTTFIRGFLKALGVRKRIASPTFVLMKGFPLRSPATKKAGFGRAYHIDAYRLHSPREAATLGLKEILADPKALVLVEWPERLKGFLPRAARTVRLVHGSRENERVIMAP